MEEKINRTVHGGISGGGRTKVEITDNVVSDHIKVQFGTGQKWVKINQTQISEIVREFQAAERTVPTIDNSVEVEEGN